MFAAALIISGIILIGFAGCALEALNRRNAQDDTKRRLANADDPHLSASARVPAYEFARHPVQHDAMKAAHGGGAAIPAVPSADNAAAGGGNRRRVKRAGRDGRLPHFHNGAQ